MFKKCYRCRKCPGIEKVGWVWIISLEALQLDTGVHGQCWLPCRAVLQETGPAHQSGYLHEKDDNEGSTSLVFSLKEKVGALAEALRIFQVSWCNDRLDLYAAISLAPSLAIDSSVAIPWPLIQAAFSALRCLTL